jgi:NADH dehydrogenase/NADH:ubiquinone oxidoreductase subunit G
MTSAVQLPFRHGAPTKVGKRIYRKQVLPVGSIDYKGRKIDFTREYLADLAKSFNDGAYDQVAFMLAPDDNSHTLDPERFRGEVKGLELSEDGLDMLVEMTEEGSAVVDQNPRLGVSARIVEDLARADGKQFTRAIQHVLGTLDPRVTGMKPWQTVNLSTDDITVVDLTAATYKGAPAMDPLTEEETAAMRALLTEQAAAKKKAEEDAKGKTPEEIAAEEQARVDAELERQVAEAIAEAGEIVNDPALEGASLTAGQKQAIDLANAHQAQVTEALTGQAALRAELDATKAASEGSAYVKAGVPPVLVELATPLLTGTHVIDLANNTKLDATDIVRKMLDECKGTVDLSGETPAMTKPSDEEKEILDRFAKQFPSK